MSKGTDRYTVRLPTDLMAEVAATIYRRNLHSEGEPWDLSAFLRVAIREKLRKMERSRCPRSKRRQAAHMRQVAAAMIDYAEERHQEIVAQRSSDGIESNPG